MRGGSSAAQSWRSQTHYKTCVRHVKNAPSSRHNLLFIFLLFFFLVLYVFCLIFSDTPYVCQFTTLASGITVSLELSKMLNTFTVDAGDKYVVLGCTRRMVGLVDASLWG